ELGESLAIDGHRAVAQLGVDFLIFEPEELAQVVAPRGALKGLGGGKMSATISSFSGEALMHLSDGPPVGPPVLPLGGLADGVVEVVDIDAVGDESRSPVMRRDLHVVRGFLGGHGLTVSLLAIASCRLEPRSRSRTSAQLRPGRPDTEPPGWVHAPF